MEINGKNIKDILIDHELWLNSNGGERADLSNTDLRWLDLRNANLSYAIIVNSDLRGVFLKNTNFSNTDISHSNLSGSDTGGANFSHANLSYTDFRGSNLSFSNFNGANMDFARLENTNLYNVAGNNKEIKSIFCTRTYLMSYTTTDLYVGCKGHRIEDWWDFSEEDIREMDGKKAVSFCNKWRDTIKMIIEKSPAVQEMF